MKKYNVEMNEYVLAGIAVNLITKMLNEGFINEGAEQEIWGMITDWSREEMEDFIKSQELGIV